MKRVIAVYDLDPFYAERFAKVANQKEKGAIYQLLHLRQWSV